MATPLPLAVLLILPALLGLLPPPCVADNILYSGSSLYPEQSLTYGSYGLIMQADCNLVLYDNGNPVWSSGTYGQGSGCRLALQSDGNLVIYDVVNRAVWASNSYKGGEGYYVLILQPDRNVVIYGGAIWATASNAAGAAVAAAGEVIKTIAKGIRIDKDV
ncbi:mannose-specific lectin-like [Typha angustifolia]|uniref:mannose-specific lectin-like n=1 Tax=Typha angustifolia TaxID=59011 RepID=UPI003C2C23F1